MAQALRAPRDPAWVADGYVSERWLPVSPVTGRIDAFEWKAPFGQVEGPVEEGSVAAEQAIANLPAVVEDAEPEPAPPPRKGNGADIITAPQAAEPQAERAAVAAKPPVPANATPEGQKAAANTKEPVPFFGYAPDDPGVKDPHAEKSTTRLRLF
jgi:HemY protein